jgi:hypothetical protein
MWRSPGSRDFPLDVAASAKTRVQQSAVQQLFRDAPVLHEVFRLPPDRLRPVQTKPLQVIPELCFKLRATTSGVNVFDPQEKSAVDRLGKIPCGKCRESMAAMQQAGRAGSEASNGSLEHWQFTGR